MNLDTYKSNAVEGLYVTLPSTETSSLAIVEELSTLALHAVRRGYQLSSRRSKAAFSRFILTEIVLKGYATHGADGSPVSVPRL